MVTFMSFIERPGYLIAVINEEWGARPLDQLINAIYNKAQSIDQTRILFDLRHIPPPKHEVVRYETGVKLAAKFNHSYRFAALGTPEFITHRTEKTAQSRGLDFRSFTDEVTAIAWLLKEKS